MERVARFTDSLVVDGPQKPCSMASMLWEVIPYQERNPYYAA